MQTISGLRFIPPPLALATYPGHLQKERAIAERSCICCTYISKARAFRRDGHMRRAMMLLFRQREASSLDASVPTFLPRASA